MNASRALAALRALGVPVVTTAEAAAALGQSEFAASKTLRRLADAGHVVRIRHGVHWVEGAAPVNRLRLPELLTAPMPSYVSMQSALNFHGMIEQIPAVVFVATLARSQTVATRVGTFSLHHLAPEVFGGFVESDGAKIASPPKALFDVAYLSAARDRRFRHLPELELPRPFAWHELRYWIARVRSARQKTIVVARLRAMLGAVVSERTLRARLGAP